MTIVIIPDEVLHCFVRPALDLQTGEIIELAAEPAPVQLELFTEVEQQLPVERAVSLAW